MHGPKGRIDDLCIQIGPSLGNEVKVLFWVWDVMGVAGHPKNKTPKKVAVIQKDN